MKLLLIGDTHAQSSNLKDLDAILTYAQQLAKDHEVGHTVFLGDIYHNHRIVSQDIMAFYKSWMPKFKNPVVIPGNHDMVGPTNTELNAVSLTLSNLVTVVEKASLISKDGNSEVWAVPFIPDNKIFIDTCRSIPNNAMLLCHQTFDGSKYDNGFFAPDGVDQNLIPQNFIISGHIHTKQVVGKVNYIGTPRAISANEANQSKYITILDTKTGQTQDFTTDGLAKQYKYFEISQGSEDLPVDLKYEKDDIRIRVSGTQDFYNNWIELNKSLIGKAKIIPNIERVKNRKIELESGRSIHDELKRYVFEITDFDENLKGRIWNRLQEIIPTQPNKNGF